MFIYRLTICSVNGAIAASSGQPIGRNLENNKKRPGQMPRAFKKSNNCRIYLAANTSPTVESRFA
jgi:hypothetical protein